MQAECSTAVVPQADPDNIQDEIRAAIMAELRGPGRAAPAARAGRVLAYERVSTSVQASIPDQKRAIEEDAATHGMEVDRHRWDEGSRWDDARPDYRALLADIDSRQYTHLWLFNADRLGGDDQGFVATVRRALKQGMVVRDTVHGEITDDMAVFLGMISYLEIKNNHYRVVLKLEGKHLEHVKLGSVPPGYEPQCRLHPCRCGRHGKHVRSEPLATLVEQLFARCAAGEPVESLRRWWNAETGQRRDHSGMLDILRNPYYAGVIVNRRWKNGKIEGRGKRKQEEWKVGTHDNPLIDPQTFATVQERVRTQENVGQHRTAGVSHPLVGLVHCLRCGRRMHRRHQSANGDTWRWECPLCIRGRAERRLERALHGLLAQIPFPEEAAVQDYAREQARMQRALEQELAAIRTERDRIQRRRSQWADDRGDGTMTKELFREKIAETDKSLDELRRQELALQDSHIAQPGRAALLSEVRDALRRMGNWTSTIEHMTQEERRGMYRCMLKAVKLDLAAGRMTVEYTEALARWCGRASDTVPLPSQKQQPAQNNGAG